MIEEFDIQPYVGALPIRFDLNRTQVFQILGPPTIIQKRAADRPENNHWPLLSIRFSSEDDLVAEISIGHPAKAMWQGADLFDAGDAVNLLQKLDGAPKWLGGAVFFLQLGILLDQFWLPRRDRCVTMFRAGGCDYLKLRPFDPNEFERLRIRDNA